MTDVNPESTAPGGGEDAPGSVLSGYQGAAGYHRHGGYHRAAETASRQGAGDGGGMTALRAGHPATPRSPETAGADTVDGANRVGHRPEPRRRPGPDYQLVRRPVACPTLHLDPEQRAVVAHTDGPLLVLGGPGTGKTTTLVEAVTARIEEGVDPDRVLVLTFDRRGANQLRTRIAARIGRTIAEPAVRTFHAYAFGVLRRLASRRDDLAPRLLSGPEQDMVIRELIAGGDPNSWPHELRPALRARGFAAELRDLMMRAAERGVWPAQLAEWGRLLRREDWVAAARFAVEYTDVLALRDATATGTVAYDPAELLRVATVSLTADPEALALEQEHARYVYVDEFHDTDPAQWELLELVAGGGRHLVVFGDPDSAIFTFRGAEPSGVYDFPHRFRTVRGEMAPSVVLPTRWRSSHEVIVATGRVAARLRGPARQRHARPAPDAPAGHVEIQLFRSVTQEAAYLAHRLRAAHLLEGVPWSRMAVLLRSTVRALGPIQRALQQAGVPVEIGAEDLPLSAQPAVRPLLTLLRCALQPQTLDEEKTVALLHSPLGGADPFAERRLRQGLRAIALRAGDRRPSGVLLTEALLDPTELAAIDNRWAEPLRRVATLLKLARDTAARPGATVEDVLWEVWQASGLQEAWTAESAAGGPRGAAADRDLDAVMALFDAAARFATRLPGAGPEVFLDYVEGQQIPADSLAPTAQLGEAVRIMTAHSAKGQEWDLVAIAGVQEGVWPDLRLRGSLLGSELLVDYAAGRTAGDADDPYGVVDRVSAQLDEERRLFYMAASRARHTLVVTAVASGDGEEQPSRFLDELAAPTDPDQAPTMRPPAQLPRALTLPALVAELRTVVTDSTASPSRRRVAAAQLARLAAAGVPGAHPDDWWGMRPLSDNRPLAGPGERVEVSPSVVEQVHRCGLRWLLERHGGSRPPGADQTVGNLVHAAAAAISRPGQPADTQALYRYLDEHWGVVEVAARWEAGRKRSQAEEMVKRLTSWLAANPRRLIAAEQGFRARLTDSDPVIEITGKADRIELDGAGRLVVIDFKTGKSIPTDEEVARHAQLGTYQLAIAYGGLEDLPGVPPSAPPGGAILVQLGKNRKDGPEQHQPALADSDDPDWAERMVRGAAAAMAAGSFNAVVNPGCATCAVRTSCPVNEQGRQVTQ